MEANERIAAARESIQAEVHAAVLRRGGLDDWMGPSEIIEVEGFNVYPSQGGDPRWCITEPDVNPDGDEGWYWVDEDDDRAVHFVAGSVTAEPVASDAIVALVTGAD